jgi:glycosyltransferase involved in cell wall biosynthesis
MNPDVKKKPKLIVVTSTFPRWKDDTDPPFVYKLSQRLSDTFDITIHAPHYPGAKKKEMIDGMEVYRFRYFPAPYEKLAGSTGMLPTLQQNKLYYGVVPFFLFFQFVSLLRLIWKIKPDCIHAHWIFPQGFLAVLLNVLVRIPVVVTGHGADVFGLKGVVFSAIKRFTLTRASNVTVVSNALAEALNGLLPSRDSVQVIPMGVDAQMFSPDRKVGLFREKYAIQDLFLLYVGRLTEKKGVWHLIDAMPILLKDLPGAKLLVVGSGELEQTLIAHVVKQGLTDQVFFVGGITNRDLPALYASADMFVAPSIEAKSGDTEGFGLTLVEASMSGCLVIASSVGGIGDIIVDGETGFLVEPGNAQLLAKKILHVRQCSTENLNELRKRGRERCMEHYDWKVVAKQYGDVLQEAM